MHWSRAIVFLSIVRVRSSHESMACPVDDVTFHLEVGLPVAWYATEQKVSGSYKWKVTFWAHIDAFSPSSRMLLAASSSLIVAKECAEKPPSVTASQQLIPSWIIRGKIYLHPTLVQRRQHFVSCLCWCWLMPHDLSLSNLLKPLSTWNVYSKRNSCRRSV